MIRKTPVLDLIDGLAGGALDSSIFAFSRRATGAAFIAILSASPSFASSGSSLSSDIQFWEQPRVGAAASAPSAGVLDRGTVLEVYHQMSDGRGGQLSYVRVSSGPMVGRYVWVNTKEAQGKPTDVAKDSGHSSRSAPTSLVKNRPAVPNAEANPQAQPKSAAGPVHSWATPEGRKQIQEMEARLTPCDLGLCQNAPSNSATSSLGKVQIAATQLNGILSKANEGHPQMGSRALSQVTWEGKREGSQWSTVVGDAIESYGSELLASAPSDIGAFCPNYSSLPDDEARKGFWVQLVSGIAEVESTFRPHASKVETIKNSKNENVVSRGLLQLSLESAQNYKCPVEKDSELHDAKTNLECGVRIVAKRVMSSGRIIGTSAKTRQGAARYWSSLRSSRKIGIVQSRTRAYCRAVASAPRI